MTDGLYGADRESVLKRLDQLEAENQELRALVEALHNKNHDLRDRVKELESLADDCDLDTSIGSDHIDQEVVAHLEPGELVGPKKFENLYKAHTTVKNEQTARDRIKPLVKHDAFEFVKPGLWRFEPNGGSVDE